MRSGVTVFGDLRVTGNIINQGVVLTRNAQTISGVKTFLDKVLLNTFATAGYAGSNDDYRLNIAGKEGEDAGIQLDSYGVGGTSQILARTARGNATNLSGLLKNDIIFNFAAKGYVSGLNNYSPNSRVAIRYVTDEDWVSGVNYTGQGTYIGIRTTNIGAPAAIDKVVISTSGLNVLDGDIYISGYPVVNTTSDQTIAGAKTFVNSGTFSNEGIPAVPLLNNPLSIVGSGNNYLQLNIQNRATGTNATADLVITANNGTDNTNYINLGINNSGYNDPAFSNGSGLDGYLFVNGGSLDIGTQTPNTAVEFHIGGTTANRAIARIDSSGINILSGTYRVNDIPSNTFTITLTHTSSAPQVGFNYFGMNEAGFSQASLGSRRRMPIAETCQIRKASWSHLVGTAPSPNDILSTGYVINTSSTPPQTGIVSTVISSISDTTPAHYITNFSPPINVTSGDLIVAALGVSGFTNAPLAVRDTVILYCYN